MRRNTKFRGKRLDTREWVFGNLIENQGRFFIYPATSETTLLDHENGRITVSAIEVDGSTIGQSSEVYDAFGNEIYEGDLIRYPERDPDADRLTYVKTAQLVVMDEGCFWLVPCDNANNEPLPLYDLNGSADPQVVGNKYEGIRAKRNK